MHSEGHLRAGAERRGGRYWSEKVSEGGHLPAHVCPQDSACSTTTFSVSGLGVWSALCHSPKLPGPSQATVICVQQVAQALPGHQNTWACPNRQLCDIEQLIPLSSPSVSPETRTPDTRLPSAGKGGRPGSEGLPSHLCSSGSVAAQSMREENGPVCRKRGDGAQLCKPGRESAPQPGVWRRICPSS